jgi:CheY-like chemotaxis protein
MIEKRLTMNDEIGKRLHALKERNATRKLKAKQAQTLPLRDITPMQVIPWVLKLRVVGTSSILNVSAGQRSTTLGRGSANGDIQPDIDLSPFNAFKNGVSRQHASISATRDFVLLTDLGSSNGTYINGMRLTAHQAVPLKHGDTVMLGDLQLQLLFNVMSTIADNKTANGYGKHILIVEEDMNVAAAYRMIFEHYGYHVSVTDNLAEIPLFLSQITPDLVICDLIMNTTVAKHTDVVHLIHREMSNNVPILVVSHMTGGHQQRQAMESGACAFLGKPVRLNELLDLAGELIGNPLSA